MLLRVSQQLIKDHTPAMPIETGIPVSNVKVVQPIVSPYRINVCSAQVVPSAPDAFTSIQSEKYVSKDFGMQFDSNQASASVSIDSQTHPIITNLKGSTVPNLTHPTVPGDNILQTISVQTVNIA